MGRTQRLALLQCGRNIAQDCTVYESARGFVDFEYGVEEEAIVAIAWQVSHI